MSLFRNTLFCVFLIALAACGGGGGGTSGGTIPSTTATPAPVSQDGEVSIQIAVPAPAATPAVRKPAYVSQATSKLRVDVSEDSNTIGFHASQTFAITASSPGCSSTTNGFACTETLNVPPGSYVAGVTAEDASGNALSIEQNIPLTVSANQTNKLALALAGVPHSIQITPVSRSFTGGDQAHGFSLIGLAAQAFSAQALDAAGSVIVGPGSPAFTVSVSGSLPVTLATPSPNTFSLTPSTTFSTAAAQVTVRASFPNGTDACAISGAACSASANVATEELVAVSSTRGTTLYANGSTTPIITFGGGSNPMPIAYDKHGDIFVGFYLSNAVAMFSPPYNGSPTLVTSGITAPLAIALDKSDNLFVAVQGGVMEYAPPYNAAPIANIQSGIMPAGLGMPEDIKVDAEGNLFAAYPGANEVGVFTPPYTSPPTVMSTGLYSPYGVALDQSDNLYVANFGMNDAVEYAPPYTASTPTNTFSDTGITGSTTLAVNTSGVVFVPSAFSRIVAFSPPYTSAPFEITNGITNGSSGYAPTGLALDNAGDLFVATATTLLRFAPPYTGTPLQATPGGSLQSIAILP